MSIKVNLSGVSTGFEALPAGTYRAYISEGEQREGKEKGTPYINWTFTVSEGEYEGRKVFRNDMLSENALFGLKETLAATEKYTAEQLDGDLEFAIDDVIGSEVRIRVTQRQYQGDTTNDVKRVRPLSAGEDPSADGSLLP